MTSKEPNTVITHSSVCALFYPSATEIAGSNSSQDINVFPRFYCLCFVPFTLKVWNGLIPQAWSPTRYLWTKFSPDLFYLLFAGAEGYCCTWLHSMTHTHTHLDEGSARRRDLYPQNTEHLQETDIHAPGGARTRNPNKQAAPDVRLKPMRSLEQDSSSSSSSSSMD